MNDQDIIDEFVDMLVKNRKFRVRAVITSPELKPANADVLLQLGNTDHRLELAVKTPKSRQTHSPGS